MRLYYFLRSGTSTGTCFIKFGLSLWFKVLVRFSGEINDVNSDLELTSNLELTSEIGYIDTFLILSFTTFIFLKRQTVLSLILPTSDR